MHLPQPPPVRDILVVQQNVRLGQECLEAIGQTELFGTLPRVIRAARTPAVERRALPVQVLDVPDDGGHRHTLRAVAADERVVYVHINDDGSHGCHAPD